MGVFYETIPDSLGPWILSQKMLWVGTAPLSGEGHINISPKGGTDFGIIDSRTFWYMDLTGSGVETHAHLYEAGNGRICVMFMAFEGKPQIVRIWGQGTALENGSPEFEAFVQDHKVPVIPGSRSIIIVSVHQCATSCGFSVPYYEFKGFRPILNDHFAKKEQKFKEGEEKEGIDYYWALKSQASIDGLPGMKRGVEYARKNGVEPLKKMKGKYAPTVPRTVRSSEPLLVLLVLFLGIVIGGTLSLSVVTPARLEALQKKEGMW